MSTGNEIPYRRSTRSKDATGSLVFDQQRKQAAAGTVPADPKAASVRKNTEGVGLRGAA